MTSRYIDFCWAQAAVVAAVTLTVAGVGAGCSGGGGGGGTGGAAMTGTGGASTTGSGGAGTGGAATTGTGGMTAGTGGNVAGSGGASIDAPMDTPSMDAPKETAADVPAGPFALTSAAFMNGQNVPLMYKCAQAGNLPMGMNISPPLSWTAGPAGTMSYAITLQHLNPQSMHWAIWDIPADTFALAPNIDHVAMPGPPAPAGSKQTRQPGLDGFSGYGYLGPCPQNPGVQMYVFTLYAIKSATIPNITTTSTVDAIFSAIQGNAVAGGHVTLTGTEQRQ